MPLQPPPGVHEGTHAPPLHVPPVHAVPLGASASAGQLALLPSHASAWSHSPAAARQTTPEPFTRLMHAPAPSHVSCASQPVLVDEPHVVPEPFGEATLSLHTGAPLPHATIPFTHAPGFVPHAEPATQGVHAPEPLHTPPEHALPGDFGDARLSLQRCKTNTVSNTAFRGFGGPQGMVGIERVMDAIAGALGKDPLAVRRANFYAPKGESAGSGRSLTPYHMEVEDCIIGELTDELVRTSEYEKRRAGIRAWNAKNPVLKRGIALTPVKFGISFTNTLMNQAGALLHLYTDGSLHLNHGGSEMGQGLFQKVAQVVAEEFQCDLSNVKITATRTDKVPNTSATAASSGSDLNGMAAREAARTIKARLAGVLAAEAGVNSSEVQFLPGRIVSGGRNFTLPEAAALAHAKRVSLSSTGYYATPKIHWDRATGKGRPFFYFAYGAAVTECAIDTLTGENRMLRVDILHDVGRSLNPAIDLGQIEGGFIQGAGWLTTEELVWDSKGRLSTHAPSTYKIPACSDRPPVMNIALWNGENSEDTIYRSKAVGEPPLMLGISALLALSDAVASVGGYAGDAALDAPATPERVLMTVQAVKVKIK